MPIILKEMDIPAKTKGRTAEEKTKRHFIEKFKIILEKPPNSECVPGIPTFKIDGKKYLLVKAGYGGIRKEQIYWMAKNIDKEIVVLFVNITHKLIGLKYEENSEVIYDKEIGFYDKKEVETISQHIFKIREHYFKGSNIIDYRELSELLIRLKKYSQYQIDDCIRVLTTRGILLKDTKNKINIL